MDFIDKEKNHHHLFIGVKLNIEFYFCWQILFVKENIFQPWFQTISKCMFLEIIFSLRSRQKSLNSFRSIFGLLRIFRVVFAINIGWTFFNPSGDNEKMITEIISHQAQYKEFLEKQKIIERIWVSDLFSFCNHNLKFRKSFLKNSSDWWCLKKRENNWEIKLLFFPSFRASFNLTTKNQ